MDIIRDEPVEQQSGRLGQETAAADMGRKGLRQQPERENGPQRIHRNPVQEGRPRGPPHPEEP